MNILITGKNSYIGENIKKHLENFNYIVDEVDTKSDEWRKVDYSKYDSVIHVAAIVHDDAKIASEELFLKVNTDLPVEIAKLSKKGGVKQFVFISTMAVFGVDKSLDSNRGKVNFDTELAPVSLYGKSKLEAERQLEKIADSDFKVSFVRPPNVYGPGCRGNYIYLFKKLAKLMFICPEAYTEVRQSMLYIDNLSELIRLIVEDNCDGVFMPQDDYAPNTVDLITYIREFCGKKTITSKFMGAIIKLFSKIAIVNKIYGGVYYEMETSNSFEYKYQIVSFKKGLELTYKG